MAPTRKKDMWQPRTPSKCVNCDSASVFERLADPDSMEYLHASMVKLQGVTSKNDVHVDAYECKVCGYVQFVTRVKLKLT